MLLSYQFVFRKDFYELSVYRSVIFEKRSCLIFHKIQKWAPLMIKFKEKLVVLVKMKNVKNMDIHGTSLKT